MKNILIIGGCGYIGSALYTVLSQKHNVDTVDLEYFGNYVNKNNTRTDFEVLSSTYLTRYDTIINVAAHSSVQMCEDLHSAFDNNVTKFVDLARKLGNQKFIYASSSCVYTTVNDVENDESMILKPLDTLTLTKTTIDSFMSLTDVEYYGLRFGSVNGYSPNMRLDLMINSMTTSARKNKEVIVTNGYAYRPILAISDLCSAVEKIIDCEEDKRGIYNIASFNDNILEIGKQVAGLLDVPLIDKGNNFTYDFKISSEKFKQTFDHEFTGTVENIVKSIMDKEHNDKWTKRTL